MQTEIYHEIPPGTCICSICKQEKDNSEFTFYENRHTKDGFRLRVNTNCRSCASERSKEKMVLEQPVKHLRPSPGSLCPSCGRPTKKFEFDHCHTTKVFRGYVCKDCNVGFGKLGDSTRGVVNALKYLWATTPDSEKQELQTTLSVLFPPPATL